ncbi:unnamed protein product [Rhodiola kirilowii]
MGKQVVKENGRIKFLVDLFLGIKFSMDGEYVKSGPNSYDVVMDDAAIIAGGFGLPVELTTKMSIELL